MAEVVLDHVTKRYPDGTEAVKDVSLTIGDGEFVILVGPSGCGKSTTLRMVAGLDSITEGEMRIADRVVNKVPPGDRDIAMVFQSYALYPHMSVGDNMGFALKLAKVDKSEIDKRVKEAADILDLTEYLDRKPRALSGGQRQRVAMGRAIVREPAAFLMDEPLSNLDAKLRVSMRAQIAGLQDRLGVTTMYVTHDQVEAMTMGDRVAVLKRGVLMQVDAPQTLYDRPNNLFVAGFIGSPAMNIAAGKLDRSGDDLTCTIGDVTLTVAPEALEHYPRIAEHVGKKVAVGLRPEHFYRPTGDSPRGEIFPGREVALVELLGSEMLVHIKTEGEGVISDEMRAAVDDEDAFAALEAQAKSGTLEFVTRFDPNNPPKVGRREDIAFHTRELHFFDYETGQALR